MKVEANNLSFAYCKPQTILSGISLSVDASQTISIVGSSGCGKSTLLRLLCGLLPNSASQVCSGRISIRGIDIANDKPSWRDLRAHGALGFMFQEPCLLPNMSLEANINLPLQMLGESADGQNLVSDYLRLTGLEDAKHKLPYQLSPGMKTRAALARTFITAPKLLLLDEPFSALDVVWKAKLYVELLKLRSDLRSTVILVTHDIFEAIYFSSRILIMGAHPSMLTEFSVANWNNAHSDNDVINTHHDAFVHIKDIIDSSQNGFRP